MNVTIVRSVGDPMEWYVQNSTACNRYMMKNAVRRAVTSENQDQNTRPRPLPMLMTPTSVAAVKALILPSSWKIGAACETTDSPAVVFMDMRPQSAHHCQVRNDSPSVKSRSDRWDSCAAVGCQPAGCQPSGGFRMKSAESTATAPYAIPRYANVGISPTVCISFPAAGAEISEPAPKPATAIPVISPRCSGNHLTRTAMGTI